MTIDFSDNIWYVRYCKIADKLPLYYCHSLFWQPYCPFEKGLYRCEFVDEFNVKVYHDARGMLVSKVMFDEHFKKPSKLRLFLHKHFIWF